MDDPLNDRERQDLERSYRAASDAQAATPAAQAATARRRRAVLAAVAEVPLAPVAPKAAARVPAAGRPWWAGLAAACVLVSSAVLVLRLQQDPEAGVADPRRAAVDAQAALPATPLPDGPSTAPQTAAAAPADVDADAQAGSGRLAASPPGRAPSQVKATAVPPSATRTGTAAPASPPGATTGVPPVESPDQRLSAPPAHRAHRATGPQQAEPEAADIATAERQAARPVARQTADLPANAMAPAAPAGPASPVAQATPNAAGSAREAVPAAAMPPLPRASPPASVKPAPAPIVPPAPALPAAAGRYEPFAGLASGWTGGRRTEAPPRASAAQAPASSWARRGSVLAAAEAQDTEALERLLAGGATLDAERDAEGRSALALAVLRGDARMVRWLIEHGANPLLPDAGGRSPQDHARAAQQAAVLQALGLR